MDHQSPGEYDDLAEEHGEYWDHDTKQEPTSSGAASPSGNDVNGQSHKQNAPLQKRRRVTRACDECRRKKIKCDGKQPCTHCTVYSYDCTYDQPSNRRRNPAPQYIESLESRVHRAEALLHMIIPNLDLNDPAVGIAVNQGFIPGLENNMSNFTADAKNQQKQQQQRETKAPGKDTDLESMVRAVGQIDLDENGNWDYHGHSSGLSFVRRMREQLGDLMGPETVATPFVKSRATSHVIDSPKSNQVESPMDSTTTSSLELPPEHVARVLCTNCITENAVLLRAVHLPSFWESFKRIYTLPSDHYVDQDHRFLPLLYSTLAVGTVFGTDVDNEYESALDQGFKYFRAARQMMDIADCRDLTSIQAVIFMILFLQSSAKLSQCYTYVGVALRSALRIGLHRSLNNGFNPLEAEMRKRVFWTIRKMDIYVGAMLGLPQTLSDEDVDQDYPLEVDDEYITKDAILPMPEGSVSLLTAFNVHTRLVIILTKIVRNVYPIKTDGGSSAGDKSYTVPFSVIREIENDLEMWKDSLPEGLSPSHHSPKLARAQQMLRLAYAFAQVLLYRPFLHFVATDKKSRQIDQRAYTCAASYVNVARNIIHLCTQMKQKGLLNGAFWFIMYATFFSILSLVYFAAENPDNPTTEALMKDALEGKAVLAALAKRSMSADRCTATLNAVFSRLPEWMREGRPNPTINKKRRPESDIQPTSQVSQTSLNMSNMQPQTQQRPSIPVKSRAHLPKVETQSYDSSMPAGTSAMSAMSGNGGYTTQSASYGQQQYGQAESSPLGANMHQFGLQHNQTNPNLPDLSAMMFPSAEPLMYPNQPLTTFENNQFSKNSSFYNMPNYKDTSAMMPQQIPGQSDNENMEAQLYALPPFMMQGNQWNMGLQNQQAQPPQQNGMSTAAEQQAMAAATMPGGMNWQTQQHAQAPGQAYSDINLNDIFGGGEWSTGLMEPGGYGQ